MSKISWLVLAGGLFLAGPRPAQGFNLLTDIKQNTNWTFGQVASAGEGYNFNSKEWDTSALAEIANYRFLSFSYGGTQLDRASTTATDTFKIGILSNFFFKWFANQPPPAMAWVENLNFGPSFAIPVFSGSTGHRGTFLLDLNFRFSGGSSTPAPAPTVPAPSSPAQ